jgi:predicted PP-loop superfamily ATPase
VTLIGGLCGHCDAAISRAVNEAVATADLDIVLTVKDIFEHKDGTYHVRLEGDQEAP